MKIINKPHTVVTLEDIMKLLTKFIENKTKKKVVNIDIPPGAAGTSFRVEFEDETIDLGEIKNG